MEQASAGHNVGIMTDAISSDVLTQSKLKAIEPHLTLGLHLVPMSRRPGVGDIAATRQLVRLARMKDANIVHGHGAKGGAYSRLAAWFLKARGHPLASFYTPHGGSLHFDPKTTEGQIYLNLEKILARFTDGLIFESKFARDVYEDHIGFSGRSVKLIPNGLRPADFGSHVPDPDAADFLFVGELRQLKGVDVMLRALATLQSETRPATAYFVGGGPDRQMFETLAQDLNLTQVTHFPGPKPALEAFPKGHCLVVPSRAESFPYIVLEAGAQAMPIIATEVGGIPEMAHGTPLKLIAPDDVPCLGTEMKRFLNQPGEFRAAAQAFKAKVETTYTVSEMTQNVLNFYGDA